MNASSLYYVTYTIFGLLMGGMLSLSGFADYEQVHRMFIFADFRLLAGFMGAVMISMAAYLFLGLGRGIGRKKYDSGTIIGSMLFGTGWAMSGACPGIALVQLGQGQLAALFTLFGVAAGAWVYRQMATGTTLKLSTTVCGEE